MACLGGMYPTFYLDLQYDIWKNIQPHARRLFVMSIVLFDSFGAINKTRLVVHEMAPLAWQAAVGPPAT